MEWSKVKNYERFTISGTFANPGQNFKFEKPRSKIPNFEVNIRNEVNKPVSPIEEIRMIEKVLDKSMYPISGYNYPSFNNESMDLIQSENFLFVAYRIIHGSHHSFKNDWKCYFHSSTAENTY